MDQRTPTWTSVASAAVHTAVNALLGDRSRMHAPNWSSLAQSGRFQRHPCSSRAPYMFEHLKAQLRRTPPDSVRLLQPCTAQLVCTTNVVWYLGPCTVADGIRRTLREKPITRWSTTRCRGGPDVITRDTSLYSCHHLTSLHS